MKPRRITCIWLPHWPMERFLRRHRNYGRSGSQPEEKERTPDPLKVLVSESRHGLLLHDCDRQARDYGLRRGQKLTDAQAACPGLEIHHADPAAEKRDLESLARWCRRWSPWTVVEGKDAVLMDSTGCAHLFGGEAAMAEAMARALAGLDLTVRIAMAPTLGAASALARYAASTLTLCPSDALSAALSPLPVAALRLEAANVLLLRRLGLKTIGTLESLPRMTLMRRFSKTGAKTRPAASRSRSASPSPLDDPAAHQPLTRLDQAFGRIDEPLSADPYVPGLRHVQTLAEPIGHVEMVLPVVEHLAQYLCVLLERLGQGARRLRLEAFRTDGSHARMDVATSHPTRDPGHILRLFKERIAGLDAGFGFEAFALEIMGWDLLSLAQASLLEKSASNEKLSALVDRLSVRLGPANLMRPLAVPSHWPERSERWVPALEYDNWIRCHGPVAAGKGPQARRPQRLFHPPQTVKVLYLLPEGPPARFVWRRVTHQVERAEGPERIAPEWWREGKNARARDYYMVEDGQGRRFWLFREGLFGDGRGGMPSWYIHGLFG